MSRAEKSESASADRATKTGKEVFNPYCDLAAPRERIEELCEKYPTIAPAIEAWKKKRMEDPKLLAKYENLEDFVDFNLSQFLQLTSEYTVRGVDGSDKKIFSSNVNFDKKLHGFKDVIEAIKEVPASKESPELQTIVGSWYSYGDTYDQINAREFFIRAAAQGYAPAQHTFGICHQQGLGVIIPHKDEARALYQKAADQGYAPAQFNLGVCHEKGIGGLKDEDKARKFYQSAADQGHAKAQNNLGACYQNGIGGEKDSSFALLHYSRAAAQKNPDAINILKLSDHSKLKIIPPHTPLDKNQIIEIINNLAPEKVRIFNKASHLIGDLVEASKGKLKEADLFEIHECLSGHLTASKVDPMKSKSCKKIQEVIAEKRKSEIDVGLAGEISHSGFDGEVPPADQMSVPTPIVAGAVVSALVGGAAVKRRGGGSGRG
jgi:TPR repeat protein